MNIKEFIRSCTYRGLKGVASVESVKEIYGYDEYRQLILTGEAYEPRPGFVRLTKNL